MKLDVQSVQQYLHKNLTLVITVAVMVLLLVIVYIPKISALSAAKADFERKARDLQSNHELIDRLVDIGNEFQATKVELARLRSDHAGDHQIPEMLGNITAAAAGLNLKLREIKPTPPQKERFFTKVSLNLDIKADYRSFAEYVDRITRIARLLDIRHMEISHDPKIYPLLSVNLLVDAHFVISSGK